MLEALKSISSVTGAVRDSVTLLATKLGGSPPQEELDAVKRISDISNASDAADFYHRVTNNYADAKPFGQDLGVFRRWETVHACSAGIINAKYWLSPLYLRESDKELLVEKSALENQITLEALLKNPRLCPSVLAQFDLFKRHFRNAYQAHHRDYNKEGSDAYSMLQEQKPKLDAIKRLNDIAEIGNPVGSDLPQRFIDLERKLITCPVTVVAQVSVESEPFCSQCRLMLKDEVPSPLVQQFCKDLDKAVHEQFKRLSQQAISQILNNSKDDKLTRFLKVVQASDLASLCSILDDNLVAFIRSLLTEKQICTVNKPVIDKLTEQFQIIEEDKLEDIVKEFQKILKEAFEAARKENPGKKVRINLK